MGRVALVTGGTRGIGEAISKGLKDAGHTVAATYAGNDEAAAKFTEETGIKTYKWNVADYDESKAGIEKVEAELGPVDIVVANAGITRDAPFHKMTPEQWHQVIDTNLTSAFLAARAQVPALIRRGGGSIVFSGSFVGVNNGGDVVDDNNHGTHCAGTIGATGNDGVGVAGVNWSVSMVGVKFLTGGGSGTLEHAVQAIREGFRGN